MLYVSNAFSLNMLLKRPQHLHARPISTDETRALLCQGFISAVGHQDTANVVGRTLGIEIPCERRNVVLDRGDKLIITQYTGPRLPEGTTALPEGAEITFWLVEL